MVGLIDVAVDGSVGMIDTLAVHPDHHRHGIAAALLSHVITHERRRQGFTALSAWTRDDPVALGWYRAMGFAETDQYLHVFADGRNDPAEPAGAIESTPRGLHLVSGFFHADMADERHLRQQFGRVHVCRRLTREL